MTILTTFARFINDLLSRILGGAGVGVAVLGGAMMVSKPEPLVAVFGQDLLAALALAALFSLAGILLLPALTRRFFHGFPRGRRRRGAVQVAVAAAVLVLSALVIRAAMAPAEWAGISGLFLRSGLAVLAVLALSWLAPGTGLDARAMGLPGGGGRRQRRADLRSIRHRRTARQAKV